MEIIQKHAKIVMVQERIFYQMRLCEAAEELLKKLKKRLHGVTYTYKVDPTFTTVVIVLKIP